MFSQPAFVSLSTFCPVNSERFRSLSSCSKDFTRTATCKAVQPKSTPPQNETDSSFAQWVQSADIRMPNLSLATFTSSSKRQSSMRGLTVTQPIKKNDSLITVPSKSALQATTTANEKPLEQFPLSTSEWRKLPWYARLALNVLSAYQQKDHPLHTWATRLPSPIDIPHHWSESDLELLQSDRLISLISKQRQSYRKVFDRIITALPNTDLSYDSFLWAVDCVRSRAFAGPLEPAPFKDRLRLTIFVTINTLLWPSVNALSWENAINGGLTAMIALAMFDIIFPRVQRIINGVELRRYAMVPGVDMFNHDNKTARDAQVEFRYFTDSFDVLSGSDYKVGDQAFISYGEQSNDAFLQYYGFVEESNPADTFIFDDDIANQVGIGSSGLVARVGGFDAAVLKGVQKRVGGDRDKAVTVLRETCRAQLDRFASTIEEDAKLLKNETGTAEQWQRLSKAIQYRREKKILLRTIIDYWDGTVVRPRR